jgi:hypothetical protein
VLRVVRRTRLRRSPRRRVLVVALVVTAVSLATVHGIPALEHLGVDHHGMPLEDLTLACLGLTATVAAALAVLGNPFGPWRRPANSVGPAIVIPALKPVPPVRAGPIELKALRL